MNFSTRTGTGDDAIVRKRKRPNTSDRGGGGGAPTAEKSSGGVAGAKGKVLYRGVSVANGGSARPGRVKPEHRPRRYRAMISIGNVAKSLGTFETPEAAAAAYDVEAAKHGRELNFPPPVPAAVAASPKANRKRKTQTQATKVGPKRQRDSCEVDMCTSMIAWGGVGPHIRRCKKHGGGKRCAHAGCPKSAQGTTGHCSTDL